MKLALVTETFPPEINGVAMTFGVIARELGRRGHAVTVYRPWRPGLPDEAARREFREFTLPGLPIPGYALLRLRTAAVASLTAQSWETIIQCFEADLAAAAAASAPR